MNDNIVAVKNNYLKAIFNIQLKVLNLVERKKSYDSDIKVYINKL